MATTKPPQPGTSNLTAPGYVFAAAFAVRVLYLTLAHTYRIHAYDDHMLFGEEMGRIARALATGYGFSDPFRGHTGPTAWVGPVFPLVLAGVFKCLGVFTPLSAWTILTINSLFSALTASAIWEIGARCFDQKVARWSAWIWVLYPAAMQYAVRWIWDTSLSTCFFTWALVMALRLRDEPTYRRWVLLGMLWALAGLSNPALLIFLPACGLWLLAGPGWQSRLVGATLGIIVFCACFAPWIWRNWVVFHQFVPARGNFGAELYLGNGPGATGLLMEYDHPIQAPDQLRLYTRMGEIAYSRMRGQQAMAIIHSNPGLFLRNTLRRVFFFWGGTPHPASSRWEEYGRSLNFVFGSVCGLMGLALALWRRVPAAGLFAWAFLLLPLVYYPVAAHARFRHPLEPLIVVLGVYLFQSAER